MNHTFAIILLNQVREKQTRKQTVPNRVARTLSPMPFARQYLLRFRLLHRQQALTQ